MTTNVFRIILAALAAGAGAASAALPQYAGILQVIAGVLAGVAVPTPGKPSAGALPPAGPAALVLALALGASAASCTTQQIVPVRALISDMYTMCPLDGTVRDCLTHLIEAGVMHVEGDAGR